MHCSVLYCTEDDDDDDKTCGFTWVRAGSRGFTRVHAGSRGFTRVHGRTTCPNAQFDTLNAQKDRKFVGWTKYAADEDAGLGAWTIGHADSRGDTHVRFLMLISIH